MLKYALCEPQARAPQRQTFESAGFDLYASEAGELLAPSTDATGQLKIHRKLVSTGVKIILPPGHEGQIRPRSGLAVKNGVTVLNTPGTIDADYTGVIKICLANLGETPFSWAVGDRIAQIVVAPTFNGGAEEVSEALVNNRDTSRGSGGFGHTGQ